MATLYRMGGEPRPRGWPAPMFPTPDAIGGIGEILVTDVIPKLLMAHGGPPRRDWQPPQIGPEEAARLAPLAIECEAHVLLDIIEDVMLRGIGVERILVELLAPAARHLGVDWRDDKIDFVQVSMGLWRLQEVMRELTARIPHPGAPDANRTALFLAMPGDDHTFGAAMAHECFGMAGWDADLLVGPTRGDLLDHVAGSHFDLVGLTVTCDCHIEPLPSLIRAVRSVSMNPNVCVMIGGRVPCQDPGLAKRVGADGTAATATTAVLVAEQLVESARAIAYA